MVKNIGPLNREIPPFGEMTVDDQHITHYMDVIDLPEGNTGEICRQHLSEEASEMLGEFALMGCHFPDKNDEPLIRTAFVCPGPSFFKKCRLSLLQATVEGEIITQGKIVK